ncbi:MAG: amidohydrolase family protein [Clostridiales bacterium]|nr:amidohydrolase family protein [Clostridiales bacterium]
MDRYECHGHIILDGADYSGAVNRHKNGPDEEYIRGVFAALKKHNITFYRDGGDKWHVSAHGRKIAGEYDIDYRTPVFAIYKKGGYGSMFGHGFDSVSDMKRLIIKARDLGADFIKLMVSGIMDFKAGGGVSGPALSLDILKEAVNICTGEGLSVMGHVNGADNIKKALEAGIKSIEHGYWADREVIDIFLQTGAVWVPTIAPVKNLLGCGRFSDAVVEGVLEQRKDILVQAYLRGVPVASGSDCGSFAVPQGEGTVDEYSYLSELGIDPERGNRIISDLFKRRA